MSESSKAHKAKAPKTLNFGVFICSTSRYNQIEAGRKRSQRRRRRHNSGVAKEGWAKGSLQKNNC